MRAVAVHRDAGAAGVLAVVALVHVVHHQRDVPQPQRGEAQPVNCLQTPASSLSSLCQTFDGKGVELTHEALGGKRNLETLPDETVLFQGWRKASGEYLK